MGSTNAILSVSFFPPIQYCTKFLLHQNIQIEQFENYQKQSYRNRCVILSANGSMILSVPVERTDAQKIPVRDIKIAYHTSWQKLHWRSIVSAYNNSPFFEFYADDIAPFFQKKYTYLFDYNIEILNVIFKISNLNFSFSFAEKYTAEVAENVLDLREAIHPKLQKAHTDIFFAPYPYAQVFSDKFPFTPNLSILDLLFNQGPDTKKILQRSIFQYSTK
ncbi:MAG TPA: hypothetical protein DEH02_10370 [Bacteroidales bacterium]|nr:hypothetical protein [Bacteroidales bacterium]